MFRCCMKRNQDVGTDTLVRPSVHQSQQSISHDGQRQMLKNRG